MSSASKLQPSDDHTVTPDKKREEKIPPLRIDGNWTWSGLEKGNYHFSVILFFLCEVHLDDLLPFLPNDIECPVLGLKAL